MREQIDRSRFALAAVACVAGAFALACSDGVPVGAVYANLAVRPAQQDFSVSRAEGMFEVVGPPPDKREYTIVIEPEDAPFAITTNTCEGSDASSSMPCSVVVAFQADAVGAWTAELVIKVEGKSAVSAALTGEVPSGCRLEASSPEAFPETRVGERSAAQAAWIENVGSSPCALGSDLTIEPVSGAADFEIERQGCTGELDPQQRCQLRIAFAPQQAGTHRGQLVARSGAWAPIELIGTGTECRLEILGPASFPITLVGQHSSPQQAWIVNTGTSKCSFDANLLIQQTAAEPADFEIVEQGCTGELEPRQLCEMSIAFAPQRPGVHRGRVSAGSEPQARLDLSGSGATVESCRLEPLSPAAFPDTLVGARSRAQRAWVLNTGMSPCALRGTSGITPAVLIQPADFVVKQQRCTGTLEPQERCEMEIEFAPMREGPHHGQLFVDPDQEDPVELTGTAVPSSGCRLEPLSPAAFPDTLVGSESIAQHAWVVNTGTRPCRLNPNLTIDPNAGGVAHFEIVDDTCAEELAPQERCQLTIAFAPRQRGAHHGQLLAGPEQLVPLELSGNAATASGCRLEAISASIFPATALGSQSDPLRGVIMNTGMAACPLHASIAIAPASPGDFTIAAQGCVASLPPQQRCEMAIAFTPKQAGLRHGQVFAGPGQLAPLELVGSGVSAMADCQLQLFGPAPFPPTQVGLETIQWAWLVNTGTTPCTVGSLITIPDDDFGIVDGTCDATLASRDSCSLRISFRPMFSGTRQGRLSAPAHSANVNLVGEGIAAPCLTVKVDRPSEKDCNARIVLVNSDTKEKCSLETAYDNGTFREFSKGPWEVQRIQPQDCVQDQFLAPLAACEFLLFACDSPLSIELGGVPLTFDNKCTCP